MYCIDCVRHNRTETFNALKGLKQKYPEQNAQGIFIICISDYNLISIGDSKSAFVTSSGAFMSSTTGAEAVVVPVEEDATTVAAVEEVSVEF